jgi:hypothetical protein
MHRTPPGSCRSCRSIPQRTSRPAPPRVGGPLPRSRGSVAARTPRRSTPPCRDSSCASERGSDIFDYDWMVGLVGFEPTTKGFTFSHRFRQAWTISSPSACAGGVRDALACHQGRCSPQVVSAPSGGAPPAWLRVANGSCREGFPEFIPFSFAPSGATSPLR